MKIIPALLNCPFCGGSVQLPDKYVTGHGDVEFRIKCNCGCTYDGGHTSEIAIRNWNRRKDNDSALRVHNGGIYSPSSGAAHSCSKDGGGLRYIWDGEKWVPGKFHPTDEDRK